METYCRAIRRRWNFGSSSRIPLSNSTRFSYARMSGGFCANSSAKSFLLKTVYLHSLHMRTSTPTSPVAFSVVLLVPKLVSTLASSAKSRRSYLLPHSDRFRSSIRYVDLRIPHVHKDGNGVDGKCNSKTLAGKTGTEVHLRRLPT